MQIRKKSKRILKNQTGASLIFVLAIMLLLMYIATSTLVAANASAGASIKKQQLNQLELSTNSIQKTIMYSLQTSSTDKNKIFTTSPTTSISNPPDADNPQTLGGQILATIYNEAIKNHSGGVINTTISYDTDISLDITPSLSDATDISTIENITINITKGINSEIATIWEEESSTGERKRIAEINATITVTTIIKDTQKKETLISAATYYLTEGLLKNNSDNFNNIEIINAGEWRLMSYAKIDQ